MNTRASRTNQRRFPGGINREFIDIMELQPIVFLDDVIRLVVRVER